MTGHTAPAKELRVIRLGLTLLHRSDNSADQDPPENFRKTWRTVEPTDDNNDTE